MRVSSLVVEGSASFLSGLAADEHRAIGITEFGVQMNLATLGAKFYRPELTKDRGHIL